jgi:nucleoside-diphosphate-sugar epimerase
MVVGGTNATVGESPRGARAPDTTRGRHALVTGPYGIVGLNVVEQLERATEWTITTLGRRSRPPVPTVEYVSADLLDPGATARVLAGATTVSHLFFAAFRYDPDPYAEIEINVTMLTSVLDALRSAGAPLERVVIYQGSKAYGALMGAMTTPAKERHPRVPGPLFYFDQEDLLHGRGAADGFTTTVLRPDYVVGIGFGRYANLLSVVAVYATLCRVLGLPLRYPGGEAGYRRLFQMTDAALLGRASVWAALEPTKDDEVYNVTNGDLIRWCNVWPRVADYFGLATADPLEIDLALFMRDKAALWGELTSAHDLEVPFEDLLDWRHAVIMRQSTEVHSSTVKIRQAGFDECLDSEDRLLELFDELQARRYIPTVR